MNIVLFTQDDPFYIKFFFEEFFKICSPIEEIKAIVIYRLFGKSNNFKLARQMYNFYGLTDFIRVGMKYAFIKMMSRKKVSISSVKNRIQRAYSLKQLAELQGVRVIERSDLNSRECMDLLGQLDPDLFISIACPIIFKEELMKIPKLDCINIHNSPLPEYRGMLPSFWQLYHGEKHAGITIHKIDKGIDTGDIISQHFVQVEQDDTLHDLIIKTKKENAQLIKDTIEKYRNGGIEYRKMGKKGSYFSFPTRQDVLEFKKMGKKLI
jgi:methionyl-tRNA formyltransferase